MGQGTQGKGLYWVQVQVPLEGNDLLNQLRELCNSAWEHYAHLAGEPPQVTWLGLSLLDWERLESCYVANEKFGHAWWDDGDVSDPVPIHLLFKGCKVFRQPISEGRYLAIMY